MSQSPVGQYLIHNGENAERKNTVPISAPYRRMIFRLHPTHNPPAHPPSNHDTILYRLFFARSTGTASTKARAHDIPTQRTHRGCPPPSISPRDHTSSCIPEREVRLDRLLLLSEGRSCCLLLPSSGSIPFRLRPLLCDDPDFSSPVPLPSSYAGANWSPVCDDPDISRAAPRPLPRDFGTCPLPCDFGPWPESNSTKALLEEIEGRGRGGGGGWTGV